MWLSLKLNENFKCRSSVTPNMFQVLTSHVAKGYLIDLSKYRRLPALPPRFSYLSATQTLAQHKVQLCNSLCNSKRLSTSTPGVGTHFLCDRPGQRPRPAPWGDLHSLAALLLYVAATKLGLIQAVSANTTVLRHLAAGTLPAPPRPPSLLHRRFLRRLVSGDRLNWFDGWSKRFSIFWASDRWLVC